MQINKFREGCDIMIATPGRLIALTEERRIFLDQLKYLIVDEADRMLDIGFMPQLQKIQDFFPQY
jgi:superfamily II DNA/RNA helicase